ncbi:MAG: hypothetical protein ACIAXF_15320 [Phycisphaerales bacterium JB063]
MFSRNQHKIQLAVCGAALLAAGTASADSVDIRFDGVQPGEDVRVYLDTDGNGTYDYNKKVTAGVMNWTNLDNGGSFETFCIELTQYISYSQVSEYTMHDDITAAPRTDGVTISEHKADLLGAFWGQFRDLVVNSDTASAFQVGIWEIVYDGDDALNLNYGQGNFSVSGHSSYSDTRNIASMWLNNLDLNGASVNLRTLSHGTRQDQITEVPTPGAAAAGLALLGMTLRRRRRSNDA